MRKWYLLACAMLLAMLARGVSADQAASPKPAAGGRPAAPPASARPASPPASQSSATSATPQMRYVATIRDIMHVLIDEPAEKIFDAVTIEVTAAGTKERRPQTDEEWDELEHSAVTLAEAVNLIKMVGRPMAPPHQMKVDPDGPELPPAEIAARVNRTRARWNKYADDLQDVALRTLTIVRNRDVKALFEIGGPIDVTCENCHLEYWYPDDRKTRE